MSDDREKKLHVIDGRDSRTTFRKHVDSIGDDLDSYIKYYTLVAEIRHVYYEGLVKQGFTEQQALHLTAELKL